MNTNPCKECEYSELMKSDNMEKPCIVCPYFQMTNAALAVFKTKPIETIGLIVNNELPVEVPKKTGLPKFFDALTHLI